MGSAIRIASAVALALGCLWFADRAALAADVLLADWENNGPTGMGGAGTDFDPAPIDGNPSCTSCWLKGNNGVSSTLTQSTVGVTHGTKSLQVAMVGKGAGGGVGLQDTHFDLGARVLWSGAQADPRFAAIRDAVNGNQGLFTMELDLTYDIPALRALHWLGPPVDYPLKPVNFIGMGVYANSNSNEDSPFQHVLEQVLPTLINPNAPAFNGVNLYTVHVSIPLEAFTLAPNPTVAPTFYEFGFSMNGNWGTNPSASNTEAASFYVDNMVLHVFDPIPPIDFNHNNAADVGDWALFMGQYLATSPTLGDIVGNFGAAGTNGKVDFADLQEFQRLYHLANPGAGAGSMAAALARVPEPTTIVLALLALTVLLAPVTRLPRRT